MDEKLCNELLGVKIMLSSILMTEKETIFIENIKKLYKDVAEEELPYFKFHAKTVEEFLTTHMADIIIISKDQYGNKVVKAKEDKKTEHVRNLIGKTNCKKLKAKKVPCLHKHYLLSNKFHASLHNNHLKRSYPNTSLRMPSPLFKKSPLAFGNYQGTNMRINHAINNYDTTARHNHYAKNQANNDFNRQTGFNNNNNNNSNNDYKQNNNANSWKIQSNSNSNNWNDNYNNNNKFNSNNINNNNNNNNFNSYKSDGLTITVNSFKNTKSIRSLGKCEVVKVPQVKDVAHNDVGAYGYNNDINDCNEDDVGRSQSTSSTLHQYEKQYKRYLEHKHQQQRLQQQASSSPMFNYSSSSANQMSIQYGRPSVFERLGTKTTFTTKTTAATKTTATTTSAATMKKLFSTSKTTMFENNWDNNNNNNYNNIDINNRNSTNNKINNNYNNTKYNNVNCVNNGNNKFKNVNIDENDVNNKNDIAIISNAIINIVDRMVSNIVSDMLSNIISDVVCKCNDDNNVSLHINHSNDSMFFSGVKDDDDDDDDDDEVRVVRFDGKKVGGGEGDVSNGGSGICRRDDDDDVRNGNDMKSNVDHKVVIGVGGGDYDEDIDDDEYEDLEDWNEIEAEKDALIRIYNDKMLPCKSFGDSVSQMSPSSLISNQPQNVLTINAQQQLQQKPQKRYELSQHLQQLQLQHLPQHARERTQQQQRSHQLWQQQSNQIQCILQQKKSQPQQQCSEQQQNSNNNSEQDQQQCRKQEHLFVNIPSNKTKTIPKLTPLNIPPVTIFSIVTKNVANISPSSPSSTTGISVQNPTSFHIAPSSPITTITVINSTTTKSTAISPGTILSSTTTTTTATKASLLSTTTVTSPSSRFLTSRSLSSSSPPPLSPASSSSPFVAFFSSPTFDENTEFFKHEISASGTIDCVEDNVVIRNLMTTSKVFARRSTGNYVIFNMTHLDDNDLDLDLDYLKLMLLGREFRVVFSKRSNKLYGILKNVDEDGAYVGIQNRDVNTFILINVLCPKLPEKSDENNNSSRIQYSIHELMAIRLQSNLRLNNQQVIKEIEKYYLTKDQSVVQLGSRPQIKLAKIVMVDEEKASVWVNMIKRRDEIEISTTTADNHSSTNSTPTLTSLKTISMTSSHVQAIECYIINYTPHDVDWTIGDKQKFKNLIKSGSTVVLKIYEKSEVKGKVIMKVDLRLLDELTYIGDALRNDPSVRLYKKLTKVDKPTYGEEVYVTQVKNRQFFHALPLKYFQDLKGLFHAMQSHYNKEDNNEDRPLTPRNLPPPPPLKPPSSDRPKSKIIISSPEAPDVPLDLSMLSSSSARSMHSKFSFSPSSLSQASPESSSSSLTSPSAISSPSSSSQDTLEFGHVYAVKSNEDGFWYRGKVLSTNFSAAFKILINYVDFGHSERFIRVSTGNIRYLLDDFRHLPMLAFDSQLAGNLQIDRTQIDLHNRLCHKVFRYFPTDVNNPLHPAILLDVSAVDDSVPLLVYN